MARAERSSRGTTKIIRPSCPSTWTLLVRLQWAAPIPVTQDPTIQGSPIAVSDGAGGAIIAWFDRRYAIPSTLNTGTLFVQRLDSAGNRLWNKDGVLVTATFGNPKYYSMVSDGNGGAIVVWEGNTEQDNCCRVILSASTRMALRFGPKAACR